MDVPLPRREPGRASEWRGRIAGLAFGAALATALVEGFGDGREAIRLGLGGVLLVAGLTVVAVKFLRRRRAARARAVAPVAVIVPPMPDPPPAPITDLDRGVGAIRRTDRGFDPTRFAGYAAMTFRDVQAARMRRDIGGLRDRLTPEMSHELHALCDRLRAAGRSNRVEEVEILAEVTEAWQDGDRDYVTACITGSMLDDTVDDATGEPVDGSRTTPRPVEQFLTFTRPAGLNFWMLSAIQGA